MYGNFIELGRGLHKGKYVTMCMKPWWLYGRYQLPVPVKGGHSHELSRLPVSKGETDVGSRIAKLKTKRG